VSKASHCASKQQQGSCALITLLLLVRATYIYIVVLRTHPVRGESQVQRNASGEVATAFSGMSFLPQCKAWNFSRLSQLYLPWVLLLLFHAFSATNDCEIFPSNLVALALD